MTKNEARALYDRFDRPIAQAHCRAAKIRDTGLTHAEYQDLCFAEAAYVYAEIAEVATIAAARGSDLAAELRAIDHDINARIELWLDQDRRISVQELNDWCRRIRAIADRLASRS